ncbi:MAG: peptidoglycan DD-metalloendopeptidase family protein [Lachnospiraceae bacterium]|nr:peptidoglycan DD-metalloendopeptidase family protein [Lachnospiraceae bacterium]
MRRRWIIVGVSLWIAGAVCIAGGLFTGDALINLPVVVSAATQSQNTQQEIDAATKKREQLENERKELQSTLDSTEDRKDDILKYISTLDGKMDKLTDKMKANEEQISLVKADISDLQLQEAQVNAKMHSQYETMKARIKYMYEDGSAGYLELLVSSKSLSEMYNHLEYVSKISEYDRKMYSEYESTQKKLVKTQEKREAKKEELEATKEALSFEKNSISELISKKKTQMTKFDELIANSEASISEYNAKIAAQEKEVENLLARQRQEIAAEEAARKKNTPNTGGGNSTAYQTPASDTASASGFLWPLPVSGRISCGFGPRSAPTKGASTYHKGIDIAVPTGTVVRAAKAGKVVTAAYSSSAGNYVAVYHGDGVYTYYMHNSSLKVSVGTEVSRGQTLALSGSTGISTGPHLHFAIYAGGAYVNPLNYVSP